MSGKQPRHNDGSSAGPRRHRNRAIVGGALGLLLVVVVVAVVLLVYTPWDSGTGPRPHGPSLATENMQHTSPKPHFVGSKACAACHTSEFHQWLGSHHQLAMQPATAATVLGNFDHATFTDAGVTTTFFRDGDKFMLRTAGPDGKPHDYPVEYTFGVYPLQQYLIPLPGGRLQAFTVAWDSRPRTAGGQRWFALYPGSGDDPDSLLYWSAPDQTWNYSCADCHSTDLHKNWNPKARNYHTSWSEVSVGCEACHGPGSNHVSWARHPDRHPDLEKTEGLTVLFNGRKGVTWQTDPTTGLIQRSRPRTRETEVETCAGCHSLRMQFHQDHVHGQPPGDDYRVELLTPQYYFPDGQIKGEVYEYGSFIQSRMFHAGVTCTDCHNPHTATLRAKGNRLCTSCHLAKKYDAPAHTHHSEASAGAQCVACHMPTRTYMRIDRRRDHSIRVPRPDLSITLGTPNACNECHKDKSPQWAAKYIENWFGPERIGFQQFGRALHAGRLGAPGAGLLLSRVITDDQQPAIARATALKLFVGLGGHDDAKSLVSQASRDPSPLVRRAAASTLSDPHLGIHLRAIARLLDNPVRSVRITAADALAGGTPATLPASTESALKSASTEYVKAQQFNADRPEAHLNLASFYARQKDYTRARSELTAALALDPTFGPAAVNLADLDRVLGHDEKAKAVLNEALRRSPDDPALLFSLGLLEVRQGNKHKALDTLRAAARNAPTNPRYSYVYAIALNDAGKTDEAISVLERSLKHNPYDRASIQALAIFCERNGNSAKARKYRNLMNRLSSGNP